MNYRITFYFILFIQKFYKFFPNPFTIYTYFKKSDTVLLLNCNLYELKG